MNVAIIPARSGSKRIPGKNIKSFAGKPIISYSIAAAKNTGLFGRIIVSTDCKRIAEVAKYAGAEVPFIRPPELSDDNTTTAPVLKHAINWLEANGERIDYFCCIYPTAPLIRWEDIKKAFNVLCEKKASEVFSVTTFDFCIFRGLKISEEGHLEMFWPENELVRSQDLPQAYHDAGQFYWFNKEAFNKNKRVWLPEALPYLIPRYLVQDIDTPADWEDVEVMYEVCKRKSLIQADV